MKILIFILIILFDQLTKFFINRHIPQDKVYEIFVFLDLINIKNKGISFGLLSETLPYWLILIVIIMIIVVISFWYFKTKNIYEKWSLICIISGAMGNLIDRLIYHSVTDFLYFHYEKYYWPAFNLADIAISIGITILLIGTYMGSKYKVKAKNE
tara:strand:- start:1430 stop:1894 length:465 start_codon:yes stop_codon:yes gene_type:complete